MFSLGRGAASSYSRKLKLNTRSSTETELVTADMFMPEMLWSLHFIQAQGYDAECVGLYQDNIRTQLLIKNGKMSSGKKTKHIKAKFFFIKDIVDDGEVKVLDCPSEQGTEFREMRAELMNRDVNYEDPPEEEESESVLLARRRCLGRVLSPQPSKHCRSVLGRTEIRGCFGGRTLEIHMEFVREASE